MKQLLVSLTFVVLLFSEFTLRAQPGQPDAGPVNGDATPGARALLREIDALSGHATLSGQHNFPNFVSRYSDRVYELTGHYPAVFGQDFGFSGGEDKDSTLGRPSMIDEVIRQYRSGAVIALTWHCVRPTDDEPVTFHDSVQGHLTDWEFRQVLTPGSDLYNRWARQVDVIAGYLQELQAAGVPVLFRPYHEMNGNWFWWGGRPGPAGSAALYRQIYDRYVHLHHLNNLIWVWNVNAPSSNASSVDAYFPGAGYADIVSMDIYGPYDQSYYDSMVALAGPHKPIALAEVGAMPSLHVLAAQPRWTYFMMWCGMAESSNSPAQLHDVFNAGNVIDRNDPRLPAPLAAPAAAPAPSDPEATAAAGALLAAIYGGRPGVTAAGITQAAGIIQAAGAGQAAKRPEIVEVGIDGVDEAAMEAAADRIRAASRAGQIPLLRWTPVAPTGAAATAALTDFEWAELLKPGSALHAAWVAQIDALAPLLESLDKQHIAVLWSPLPEANGRSYWWSGHAGPDGSVALVRELRERLIGEHRLHSLVWLWEPALTPPAAGSPRPASLEDFYPGPLGVDALMLDVAASFPGRGFGVRGIQAIAGGKPVGLRAHAPLPDAATADGMLWTDIVP